jgi:hypothetical protein
LDGAPLAASPLTDAANLAAAPLADSTAAADSVAAPLVAASPLAAALSGTSPLAAAPMAVVSMAAVPVAFAPEIWWIEIDIDVSVWTGTTVQVSFCLFAMNWFFPKIVSSILKLRID